MITLSCHHTVDDFCDSYSIIVKSTTRYNTSAVVYMDVCANCKKMYEAEHLTFDTTEQAMEWLSTQESEDEY